MDIKTIMNRVKCTIEILEKEYLLFMNSIFYNHSISSNNNKRRLEGRNLYFYIYILKYSQIKPLINFTLRQKFGLN